MDYINIYEYCRKAVIIKAEFVFICSDDLDELDTSTSGIWGDWPVVNQVGNSLIVYP